VFIIISGDLTRISLGRSAITMPKQLMNTAELIKEIFGENLFDSATLQESSFMPRKYQYRPHHSCLVLVVF
jgi:hypothetical protein